MFFSKQNLQKKCFWLKLIRKVQKSFLAKKIFFEKWPEKQNVGVRWFFRRTHARRTLRFLPARTSHALVLFPCFPTAPALAPTHIQYVSFFIRLNKRILFWIDILKNQWTSNFLSVFYMERNNFLKWLKRKLKVRLTSCLVVSFQPYYW